MSPPPDAVPLELPHRSDTPVRSETEQLAFFDAAMERALLAGARAGTVVRHIAVAGTRIALEFAGDSLLPVLFPALSHLEVDADGPVDVRLHLWDSQSTGVEAPPPPCPRECFTDRGDIWGWTSPRVRSAFHWIEFSLNLLDVERRNGIFWVRSADRLPYWTSASPLRSLLHWWMEANGGQLLHAAAVGTDRGALLITGKGGAGKSTTALATLSAGLSYVADDYCVVRLDPEPTVHSLYCTAKLDRSQLWRFPALTPYAVNLATEDEKVVVRLYPSFDGRLARSLPLVGVASPRFAGRPETSFGPISAIALQRAAAFTTMSQLPHAGRATHAFIERMTNRLPGVEVRLGSDIGAIPGAIRDLVENSARIPATAGAKIHGADGVGMPLVSVIIPVYNGGAFLPEAIRNVQAQEYPAVEIIVVDDGSTEDIGAVVRALPIDVRFFTQDNAGAGAARNRGIRDSSGEFVAFLDVDDLWPAGNLSTLVDRLVEHPEADLVRGRAQVTRYTSAGEPGEYLGSPSESFPHYIGSGVYRRRAFETVGLFDPELRFGEDTDWYARARERGLRIVEVEEVTLFVRRHDGNMTRGKTLVELNQLRLFKKALDRKRSLSPSLE